MSLIHRMYLRGPWQYQWLYGPHPLPTGIDHSVSESIVASQNQNLLLSDSRVRMPSNLCDAFGVVAGHLLLRRRFQKPTNLDADERVHLTFEGVSGHAVMSVNGTRLGECSNPDTPVSFDVTSLLQKSNELTVELEVQGIDSNGHSGLWGLVAIEIHRVE